MRVPNGAPVRQAINAFIRLRARLAEYIYITTVPSTRPSGDYTARLRPRYDDIAMPLEDAHILWQR